MSHEELIHQIALEFEKNKHLSLGEELEVKPGQIRKINDKDLQSESRLGLILGVNKLGRTCEVALVDGLVDFATSRDFEAKFITSDNSLTIYGDFQGNVDLDQIEVPNLIGSICDVCSKAINQLRLNQDIHSSVELPVHGCFKWGSYTISPLSRMAEFREEEYFQFYQLLNKFEDFNKFIESREYQYFYSKQESMSNLIVNISHKFPKAVDRKELLDQIKKNPKQLAVLRGR